MRCDRAYRFRASTAQGVGHGRAGVAFNLSRVTDDASACTRGFARQRLWVMIERGVAGGLASGAGNSSDKEQNNEGEAEKDSSYWGREMSTLGHLAEPIEKNGSGSLLAFRLFPRPAQNEKTYLYIV
jgi:hypothetical protein